MGMIFISHSSENAELARGLALALRERGYGSLFLDVDPGTGIQAGEAWQATLYRKLRSCNVLVALVTDQYLRSKWCFAEVALARMQGKHLYGILAPPLADEPDLPALISDRQLVDGRHDFDQAVERLVGGMKAAGLGAHDFRSWRRDRPPYPGFSAFEEEDAGVFFGRDREIERGLEMVRGSVRGTASRLGLLLGGSGSGKSSLLRAGIVPGLRREEDLMVVGPFRPGPEPLDELAWQTARAFGVEADRLAELADPRPDDPVSLDGLMRRLLREASPRRSHALLLVDQFEELLGRPSDHPAHAFLSLLRRPLQDPEACLSVLATLRSDQLGRLQSHPSAAGLEWQTLFVGPLDAAALRSIIEQPARLAELELEAGLTDLLIADTTSAEALPLLALTLRRLWERGGEDGVLEIEEYRRLGGIRGAVAGVADDALAGVTGGDELDALREALLRMVRLDENGTAVRQPLRWEDTPPAARPLLDRFVQSRLLVRERDTIQVAHEALFTAWSRLRGWIDEHREALVVQHRVRQAAELWREGRDEGDLWRGARLDRALELQQAGGLVLGEVGRRFLAASRAAREAAREERERRERERERLSRLALGRGLAYQALAEAEDRPQRGLLLAAEAVRTTSEHGLGVTAVAENALRELLSRSGGEAMGAFDAKVGRLAFDPGGRWLAVGCEDGTVGRLPLGPVESGVGQWRAPGVGGAVADLVITDRRIVARSADGMVRIWDAGADGVGPVREMRPSDSRDTVSALDPRGRMLATAREGGGLVLHDLEAEADRPIELQAAPTRALAFSQDGRWLADGRDDGNLLLWDLSAPAGQPRAVRVEAHAEAVKRVAWASRGTCFVTVGADHALRRWGFGEEEGELELAEMPATGSAVLDLAMSPRGDVVVAGTWHSETLCWLADDGFSEPVVLTGHGSSVGSVAVRDDGEWIVTASPRDNFALLWPVSMLRQNPSPQALRGEDRWLDVVRFAPDGSIVAGSWAGTVRRWRRLTEEPEQMPIPGVDLNRYVLSRDGSRLVAAGASVALGGEIDPRGKLVSLADGRVEPIDDPPTAAAVAMSPDGSVVVVGSHEGVIRVTDRTAGVDRTFSHALEGWSSTLTLDPSGRWLVAANPDTAVLFDLTDDSGGTGTELVRGFLRHAVFDEAGGRLLTAGVDHEVRLWRREGEGFAPGPSVRHEGVRWCAFLPAGGWVSGSGESLQRIDPDGGAPPLLLPYGRDEDNPRFALAGSGRRVAVAGNVHVVSWDLGAADPPATRLDLPRHEGFVQSMAVSRDGSRLATAMIDGPVRLWDVSAPTHVVALPQATRDVMLLAFVDRDRRLVTGDSDGVLAVWDLDPASMIHRGRRLAGRELTAEEHARFLAI